MPHDRRDAALVPDPSRARDRVRTPTTPPHLLGRLPRLGTPARQRRRLLPPDPAARPHRRHRPGHRRDRPVYDTAAEPGGVLHVACGNRRESVCPACSAVYKRDARQLVRAGPGRRQGHPRNDRRAPVRVRHPHRPVVRPGPLPPDARQHRAALPSPPRRRKRAVCPHGRDISCPARHDEDDPRLGRPMCPRLLRLPRRRAVQRLRRGPVAPVHHLPAPPPGPPAWASPRSSSAPWSGSGTSRSPNTRPAASSTSTPSSASTPPATTTSPRRLASTPTCSATPSASRRCRPPRSSRPATGTGRDAALRRAARHRHPAIRRRRPRRQRPPLSHQAVANYIAKYATKTLDRPRPARPAAPAPDRHRAAALPGPPRG